MKRLLFTVLLLSTVFSVQAFAQGYIEGSRGALQANHETLVGMSHLQLEHLAQNALNTMVRQANITLTDKGYGAEAQAYQAEWDRHYSMALISEFELFNLGDHKPLNAWLADFYKKLQFRLGDPILKHFHLDDINTMNYALPVVFQPAGDRRNGDHWNQLEYKRHFVPFAGVVTYWGAYIGCTIATKSNPAIKRYCGLAATTLKNLMRSTIAPKLSDKIYGKFGKSNADMLAGQLDMLDTMAADQVARIPQN